MCAKHTKTQVKTEFVPIVVVSDERGELHSWGTLDILDDEAVNPRDNEGFTAQVWNVRKDAYCVLTETRTALLRQSRIPEYAEGSSDEHIQDVIFPLRYAHLSHVFSALTSHGFAEELDFSDFI